MGVPAFFRWLSRKYPSIIVYCVEDKPEDVNGTKIPVDSSRPNPNGLEFDNLYLDMNGVIHPCTHPEDKPAPKDEAEMMIAIFECIDRLFSIVRPRKLLYMAIDGVAPRAKMNQQRSRRFRASKESVEKIEEVARLREELLAKGAYLPPEKPKGSHFDSNCITPGTPFMSRLSTCLNYYIHERLNNDPGWKGIKVILSDANVPGEGEHKIMDFIRKQRAQPDHDPNTQHVLCGADADLIMLGLATHEPNFTIIREEFTPNKPSPCEICHQLGHEMKNCVGCPKPADGVVEVPSFSAETSYIFVRLSVLREYLERELTMPNLPFKYDFERAIDDWVFMCFFVGNDFLPHLPSLEIREGAIDRLVGLYKECVYKTGGFVTDSGDVNLNRVQLILNELGKVEDEIFKKRQQTEKMFKQRRAERKKFALENRDGKPAWIPSGQFAPTPLGVNSQATPILNPRQSAYQGRMQGLNTKAGLEALIRPENQGQAKGPREDDSSDEEPPDEVRLWEDGFKDRYYESKFDVSKDDIRFRIKVAHEYVRGLCWVLRYYYQGCASWKWFFPFHYAPFASDFVNVGQLSIVFEKGTQPFRPLEQLMGVFPAASSSHVPKSWANLMHDPYSPIIDFYPIDFKIDLNGKKFAWQGVALLPFVDENRLFKALKPFYDQLTPDERRRNVRGDDKVYVGVGNVGYKFLKGLYESSEPITEEEFDFCSDGMRGKIILSSDFVGFMGTLLSPVPNLPEVRENAVVSARFRDLTYSVDYIFKAKRLKGVVEPQRVLKPTDLGFDQGAWRNRMPQLGMVPATQRASLGVAGHRMLGHFNQTSPNFNNLQDINLGGGFGQRGGVGGVGGIGGVGAVGGIGGGGSGRVSGQGTYSQVPPPSVLGLFPQFFRQSNSNQAYGYSTVGSSNAHQGSYSNNNTNNARFTSQTDTTFRNNNSNNNGRFNNPNQRMDSWNYSNQQHQNQDSRRSYQDRDNRYTSNRDSRGGGRGGGGGSYSDRNNRQGRGGQNDWSYNSNRGYGGGYRR